MAIPLANHCIIELVEPQERLDSWIKTQSPIIRVSVNLTTDKSSEAVLVVSDPAYRFTDHYISTAGMPQLTARFWLGFNSPDGKDGTIYTGLLARHEWKDGEATFVFHDKSLKMKQARRSRYHKKISDIAILRKLAIEYNLKFSGPDRKDDGDMHDDVMQYSKTDWQLAQEVARRQGLRIWVHGETFFAKEANTIKTPVAQIIIGKDSRLLRGYEFNYKLPENKRGRPSLVQYRGRAAGGKLLTESSDENTRGIGEVIGRESLPTNSRLAAQRLAQSKKDRRREHAFEGTITLLPHYPEGGRINVRDTVDIREAGELYSGLYIVGETRYEFAAGRLEQQLNIHRDFPTVRDLENNLALREHFKPEGYNA
jgi:hypothetical protein